MSEPAWKDKLRPASFRDVPFQVESDDMTVGRRVQVFEYPQRDKPFSEDLGRATREINIPGYVIGPDYMAGRDALLAALETPGPGTLVHPWYGSLQVIAKPAKVSHSLDEGGMCRFSLVFVEAGELSFPSSADAPGAKTEAAAEAVKTSAMDDFARAFSVEGWPKFVAADAVATLGAGLSQLQGIASRVTGLIDNPLSAIGQLNSDLGALVRTPMALAQRVMGLFNGARGLFATVSGFFGDGDAANYRAVSGAVAGVSQFKPSAIPPGQLTPARQQIIQNRDAANALIRRALLTQAASMVAAMPLPVHDDAVALRRDLGRALDDESLTASDETYRVLQDARAAAHKDIGQRIDGAARLNTITPAEPTPALVLAHDLYEDVGRDGEITARNKIKHPGFVPAEPIKVLSV